MIRVPKTVMFLTCSISFVVLVIKVAVPKELY